MLAFEAGLHQFVKSSYAALIDKIETSKDLDADAEKELAAAIEAFKKSWV